MPAATQDAAAWDGCRIAPAPSPRASVRSAGRSVTPASAATAAQTSAAVVAGTVRLDGSRRRWLRAVGEQDLVHRTAAECGQHGVAPRHDRAAAPALPEVAGEHRVVAPAAAGAEHPIDLLDDDRPVHVAGPGRRRQSHHQVGDAARAEGQDGRHLAPRPRDEQHLGLVALHLGDEPLREVDVVLRPGCPHP